MFQFALRAMVAVTMSLLALLALEGTTIAKGFAPGCPGASFPTLSKEGLGIDAQCPIEGSGGTEAMQNSAKNNFCAGGPAIPITIDEMRSLQAQVEQHKAINFGNVRDHPLSTKPGPTKNRAPLKALGEGTVRTLEGFVMIARQEGKESVNCGKDVPNQAVFHDIHITIVGTEEETHGDECDGVVAEMSPHHRPDSWTQKNVQKVAAAHARVRVSGQLFFDSSHSPCSEGTPVPGDPRRASLWEIHPIYKFDVCDAEDCTTAENWLSLDEWIGQNP